MPKDHDLAEEVSHLHQEVGQLHVEINALSDLIEDLSGAIRYCTNNLLDDRFLSDVMAQFKRVVDQRSIEQNRAEGIASEEDGVGPAKPAVLAVDRDADKIPQVVQELIKSIVTGLQQEGQQHRAAANYGAITEMQWWENRGNTVLAYNRRLQELREQGQERQIDIQPLIEEFGGVPEAMVIDEVPDLGSEPAFPERQTRQATLFDEQMHRPTPGKEESSGIMEQRAS